MGQFFQREQELNCLLNGFDCLHGAKIITIQGLSGSGKTRLIQEFYNSIARHTEYWRAKNSVSGKKETEVLLDFQFAPEDLPWLFLTTRSIESKGNNYDFTFDRIRQQFSYHLPQIIKTIKNKAKNRKIANSALGVLLNFSIPGSGNIVELINLIKDGANGTVNVIDLIAHINDKVIGNTSYTQNELYLSESQNLTQELLNVLNELYYRNRGFKIIIYLEDFHWIDLYSQQVIKDLFHQANEKGWNVLFIVSHWPSHIFSAGSTECKVLSNFYDWIATLDKRQSYYDCLYVKNLNKDSLRRIVKERLASLQPEAVEVLVQRCQGDVDLLNDFIDEIAQSFGWLVNGELVVNLQKLYELPSKSIEMAKSRLYSFPEGVRRHLVWSSLQGVVFDYEIVINLINTFDDSNNFLVNIRKAEDEFGIISTNKSGTLEITAEFKRAVFFEACTSFIQRHPNLNDFKIYLINQINDLIQGTKWMQLKRDVRTRIVETFSYLVHTTKNISKEVKHTLIDSLLSISQEKLLIGDYSSSIDICTEVSKALNEIDVPTKNKLYSILSEAFYYSGEIQREKETYEQWTSISTTNSYEFHIQYAKFLRRYSLPEESIKQVKEALSKSVGKYDNINAKIEMAKCLWAGGLQYDAYNLLKEMDSRFLKDISTNDTLQMSYYHACCLVLHDLDKNKQAVQYASKCIDKYEGAGNIQSMLISRVNYGDALWSLGLVGNAEEHLKQTCVLAEQYDLPHVKDIAYICYANVLSSLNKLDLANSFYRKGIDLAEQINHDWDFIYGRIYEGVFRLKQKQKGVIDFIPILDLCVKSGYYYLADLAFSAICHQKFHLKTEMDLRDITYQPSLPIGKVFFHSTLILIDDFDETDVSDFIRFLGKCEGIRLSVEQVALTIKKIINDKLTSDPVLSEFLSRWLNVYCDQIDSDTAIKLKACDYKACEARCCYDGVYLQEGEVDKIVGAVSSNPKYFEHLPEKYIIEGTWEGSVGVKTATRAYSYKSPDFPDHFNHTRCVFAYDDGACSLQRLSLDISSYGWTYKPKACRIHPLQTSKGEFYAPPSNVEEDKYNLGVGYPGYVSYTQCGISRKDGSLWIEELENEIDNFMSDDL